MSQKPIADYSDIRTRIETHVLRYIEELVNERKPSLKLARRRRKKKVVPFAAPVHLSSDSGYTITKFGIQNGNRHSKIWKCLALLYMIAGSEKKDCTQREVYYILLKYFQHQRELDKTILDVSSLLGVSRHCLGIDCGSRGFLYGDLEIFESPTSVLDCSNSPQLISTAVMNSSFSFRSSAHYIIVVEKEGIFSNLVQNHFCQKIPAILVTGMGYPSLACRVLVKKLVHGTSCEVLGLFDYNPYGLSILMSFKFGSARMPLECTQWCVPEMKWLGLRYNDVSESGMLKNSSEPFTQYDRQMIKSLRKSDFIRGTKEYCYEVTNMMKCGRKVELQAIHEFGLDFLSTQYLPTKVIEHDYI